ncbi:hypothetical protein PENSPDRAFT_441315 [Peniophora sp. CONT]|nr:hypothetical protein PENSPDRAFT_441315 [Peniophora sp. CONT]
MTKRQHLSTNLYATNMKDFITGVNEDPTPDYVGLPSKRKGDDGLENAPTRVNPAVTELFEGRLPLTFTSFSDAIEKMMNDPNEELPPGYFALPEVMNPPIQSAPPPLVLPPLASPSPPTRKTVPIVVPLPHTSEMHAHEHAQALNSILLWQTYMRGDPRTAQHSTAYRQSLKAAHAPLLPSLDNDRPLPPASPVNDELYEYLWRANRKTKHTTFEELSMFDAASTYSFHRLIQATTAGGESARAVGLAPSVIKAATTLKIIQSQYAHLVSPDSFNTRWESMSNPPTPMPDFEASQFPELPKKSFGRWHTRPPARHEEAWTQEKETRRAARDKFDAALPQMTAFNAQRAGALLDNKNRDYKRAMTMDEGVELCLRTDGLEKEWMRYIKFDQHAIANNEGNVITLVLLNLLSQNVMTFAERLSLFRMIFLASMSSSSISCVIPMITFAIARLVKNGPEHEATNKALEVVRLLATCAAVRLATHFSAREGVHIENSDWDFASAHRWIIQAAYGLCLGCDLPADWSPFTRPRKDEQLNGQCRAEDIGNSMILANTTMFQRSHPDWDVVVRLIGDSFRYLATLLNCPSKFDAEIQSGLGITIVIVAIACSVWTITHVDNGCKYTVKISYVEAFLVVLMLAPVNADATASVASSSASSTLPLASQSAVALTSSASIAPSAPSSSCSTSASAAPPPATPVYSPSDVAMVERIVSKHHAWLSQPHFAYLRPQHVAQTLAEHARDCDEARWQFLRPQKPLYIAPPPPVTFAIPNTLSGIPPIPIYAKTRPVTDAQPSMEED